MKNIKQIIIIFLIIIMIIIVDIIMANYTRKYVEQVNDKLVAIDEILEKNESAKDMADELVQNWDKIEKVISCYYEHDEVEKIGSKIALIKKQIEIDSLDDARQNISELQYLLSQIEEKQTLSIKNFF